MVESPRLLPCLLPHCPLPHAIMTETLGMSVETPLDFWAEWRKKGLEKNEGRREYALKKGGKLEQGAEEQPRH